MNLRNETLLKEGASLFHITWRLGSKLTPSRIHCLLSLLMLSMFIVLAGSRSNACVELHTDVVGLPMSLSSGTCVRVSLQTLVSGLQCQDPAKPGVTFIQKAVHPSP